MPGSIPPEWGMVTREKNGRLEYNMVFARKARKRAAKPKYRRRKQHRKDIRYFTEIFDAGNLKINSDTIVDQPGQQWQVMWSSIPQQASYSLLWKKYKILSYKVMMLPAYNGTELNQFGLVNNNDTLGSAAVCSVTPRMAYVVEKDAAPANASTEIALLTRDGARVRQAIGKPFSITVSSPRPALEVNSAAGPVETYNKAWMDTLVDYNILHGCLSTYVSAAGQYNRDANIARVYIKVKFALTEPR